LTFVDLGRDNDIFSEDNDNEEDEVDDDDDDSYDVLDSVTAFALSCWSGSEDVVVVVVVVVEGDVEGVIEEIEGGTRIDFSLGGG
jgi:hypothetical protein